MLGLAAPWPIYAHVERRWRDLDTCQFRTVPRMGSWRGRWGVDAARIRHGADDRHAVKLAPFVEGQSEAPRTGITAVAMEMGEAYRTARRAHVPEAQHQIVVDTFRTFPVMRSRLAPMKQGARRLTGTHTKPRRALLCSVFSAWAVQQSNRHPEASVSAPTPWPLPRPSPP
jgi:hypothetical protein